MQISVRGKKVLLRVDFNVPLNDHFEITDDTRIVAALPTIRYIIAEGGFPILMSHLGRPQKKRLDNGSINVAKFTLQHLQKHLGELTSQEILFCPSTVGPEAIEAAKNLQAGQILLLENTRFEAGEEKGDEELARKMADIGDVYVNDAFGTAHRAHASTTTVAQYFSADQKAFGFLMKAEIENADKLLKTPNHPVTAIVGGAKVSDKILLLNSLLEFVDNLIIGGAMAYTFVKATGGQTGNSLVEEDKLDLALNLLEKAKKSNVQLLLPSDSISAAAFSNEAERKTSSSSEIPEGWMGLDIGATARNTFDGVIKNSKTILWNGPMGVFEMPNFAEGTKAVALSVAAATKNGAFSLIGGGDSVAAIKQLGLDDEVSFVSTGGGAMLEYLEGKELPGISAIQSRL